VEQRMDKIKFLDTNALLDLHEKLNDYGLIYISSLALHELEHIKTSKTKDSNAVLFISTAWQTVRLFMRV
jgi:hypothetical protein